jgi:ribonuclease BN (tRNA processing enzyme)
MSISRPSTHAASRVIASAALAFAVPFNAVATGGCADGRVELLVLGSGGPDFADGRASTGYAVLLDGKARLLVDAGAGTAARFHREGLQFQQLSALLITHLHVDHVADLAAYLKAAWFGPRDSALPILGPDGGGRMPSIDGFVRELIGAAGKSPFGYLAGYLDASDGFNFAVQPRVVKRSTTLNRISGLPGDLEVHAISVDHGPNPALAWRVEAAGCVLAFSGDTAASDHALTTLAADAHLLVAHNAVPQTARGAALRLHMPPSRIGEVAAAAHVGKLLLSHRMRRTRGVEDLTLDAIRLHYGGPVQFAEDGQRIRP